MVSENTQPGGAEQAPSGPRRRAERRPEMIRQRRQARAVAAQRQQRQRRVMQGIAGLIGLVLLLGVGYTVYAYATQEEGPGQEVADIGREHIARDAEGNIPEHEEYNTVPPTSGPHLGAEVAQWGVHEEPIEDEVQVHNLEHGGVFLQYDCEDCEETIELLERFANPATGYPTKVVAAPYEGIEDGEVALTAWNRILTLDAEEVTPEIVREFIEAYIDEGPERIPSETFLLEQWREDEDAPRPWDV